MSAYIVDPEHIHTLLWAASRPFIPYGPLRWYYDNPTRAGEATSDTLDVVGQMLLDANAASVNYRYDEDELYVYAYQRPRHSTWTNVDLLKALACYEYQSCETADWATSQAHAFCAALRHRLIQSLPGYDAGPWEITADTVPDHRPAPTPH